MEAYYFIYTRILTEDYQAMYFPSDQQCPRREVYNKFTDLARGVINTDNYAVQLDKPIWLLARQSGYTLWGMGILNQMLNPDFANDRVGSPIRGFFGLIFKESPKVLPYDIQYFKSIYNTLIVPNWNADTYHCYHEGFVCDMDFSQYATVAAEESGILLNTLSNKTLILGDVDVKKAISQAMYTPNAGIVVGLQEEAHAFSDKYKYPNVWIEGHERSEFTYPVEEKEKGSVSTGIGTIGKSLYENPWEEPPVYEGTGGERRGGGLEPPKKEFGSKNVERAIAFLIVLLAVFFLMKKCLSSKNHSSSQVTIEQPMDTTSQR